MRNVGDHVGGCYQSLHRTSEGRVTFRGFQSLLDCIQLVRTVDELFLEIERSLLQCKILDKNKEPFSYRDV